MIRDDRGRFIKEPPPSVTWDLLGYLWDVVRKADVLLRPDGVEIGGLTFVHRMARLERSMARLHEFYNPDGRVENGRRRR